MRRISKEEAVAVVMEDIAAGRYRKWPEQCPHCQEPLPADMMGYKVAEARGAAEERAAVVAHLTEGADLAGPGDARRVLLAASDGIKHGEHRREGEGVTVDDRRCRAVSPQGITCGLENGHGGEHNALGWGVDLGEGEG